MEFEQIREKLKDFLSVEKKIPSSAIKTDLIFSTPEDNGVAIYMPHLAIVDKDNQLLCLFIIDDRKNRILNNFINIHLHNINKIIGKSIIIYFVSYSNDQNLQFSEVLEDGSLTSIEKDNFPNYEMMKNNLFVLQSFTVNQLKKENNLFRNIKEKEKKYNVLTAKILSILISIMALTSILLYIKDINTNIDFSNTFSNQVANDSLSKKIDSLFINFNAIKEQKSAMIIKRDTIIINTTYPYQELNKRIEIIEKGISTNPEKTLSNIKLEQRINNLESKINDLKESFVLRNEAINTNISLISNLVISLYTGLAICILSWLLSFLWRKK